MGNPLEKAKNITSQVKNSKEEQEKQAVTDRLGSLVSDKEEAEMLQKQVVENKRALDKKSQEGKSEIEKNKTRRKEIQTEGKSAAEELRRLPETAEILKDETTRNEVFGEAMTELKGLNESVKSIREEIANSKAENLSEWKEKLSQINQKQIEFQKQYDAWTLNNEVHTVQEKRKGILPNLVALESFKEEYTGNLNDTIEFDQRYYHKFKDLKLEGELQAIDDKTGVLYHERESLSDQKKALKKGLFESQKKFEERQADAQKLIDEKQKEVDACSYGDVSRKRNEIEEFLGKQAHLLGGTFHNIDAGKIPKKEKYPTQEEVDQYVKETYTTVRKIIDRVQEHFQSEYDSHQVKEETTRARELKNALEQLKNSLEYAVDQASK